MQNQFLNKQDGIFPDSTFWDSTGIKKPPKTLARVAEKKYYSTEKILIFFKKRGLQISKSKLYKLTSAEDIPFSKFNNKLIFEKQELLPWIEKQKINPLLIKRESVAIISKSANAKLNAKTKKK